MAKKKYEDSDEENESNQEDLDEPNFSDEEDYIDNISDKELLGDFLESRPTLDKGHDGVVVVDGIPQVGQEKIQKLRKAIDGIFKKFGDLHDQYYPTAEDGKTKGYAYFDYKNASDAKEAIRTCNGFRLDRQHTFCVNHYTDFEKYEKIADKWEEPKPKPYKDHGNLSWFLLEPDCFDQYSVVFQAGDTTAVMLNSVPEPSTLEERQRWTDTYVRWSPMGTYLATFHKRGIALWGGEKFQQIIKFSHEDVQYIDFSPCENYVVTLSPSMETKGEGTPSVIIWEILTGTEKRSFSFEQEKNMWPMFKWSHDDAYFARCGQDMISIYETPSFGLLGKKSIKVEGVRDFSWSPTENILAYWVAEDDNIPARVTLLSIPLRNEVRVKNLFNVADCGIFWQKSGDYLCVKCDRYSKVKKEKGEKPKYSGMYCNFELFHMQEKEIPVDSVEIKDTVQYFSWEPVGSKFAIVHGEAPSICVSFYEVKKGQTPILAKKMDHKSCNQVFWSPQGQYIVLAQMGSTGGALEFIDTSDYATMNQSEHYQVTSVDWDSTGRYVVSGVSYWNIKVDNGYWLWSFQGKLLQRHEKEKEKFCQLQWRPRPPSVLTKKDIKDLKKNLKKYSMQFELKDRRRATAENKELVEKRIKLLDEYKGYRAQKVKEWNQQKQRRLQLRNGIDTDELDSHAENLEEEIVEFLVNEEEVLAEE